MKALGLVVSDKTLFNNCILKTYFYPCDLLMPPIRTIFKLIILAGDHPGIVPAEFDQKCPLAVQ